MDNYPLKPENMRAPAHLTRSEVQKSLEELDSKIKILQGRANATAAGSNHTYHEHIAGLEQKRALIAAKLSDSEEQSQDWWDELKRKVETLQTDIKKMFD